jgi:hypothetical protein
MVYGDDLIEGRLVRLFTQTLPGNQFILALRSSPLRKALDDFVDWILGACEAHKERMKKVIGAPRVARKPGRRVSPSP